MTLPISGNFSWANQGDATLDTTNGAMTITCPTSNGGSDSERQLLATVPVAPYTVTFAFNLCFGTSSSSVVALGGPCLKDGSGKTIAYQFRTDSGLNQLSIDKFTNPTTYAGSSYLATTPFATLTGSVIWARIQDTSVNRIFSVSHDGSHFLQVHSVGNTDYITPTLIGFFGDPYNTPLLISLLSFNVTNP
jgi:hypothetical protein